MEKAFAPLRRQAEQMEKAFAPLRNYAEALSKVGQGLASKLKQMEAVLTRVREAGQAVAQSFARRLWALARQKAQRSPALKLRLVVRLVGRVVVESPPIPKPLSVLSTHSASNAPNACYRKRPRSVSRDHRLEAGSKLEVK